MAKSAFDPVTDNGFPDLLADGKADPFLGAAVFTRVKHQCGAGLTAAPAVCAVKIRPPPEAHGCGKH